MLTNEQWTLLLESAWSSYEPTLHPGDPDRDWKLFNEQLLATYRQAYTNAGVAPPKVG